MNLSPESARSSEWTQPPTVEDVSWLRSKRRLAVTPETQHEAAREIREIAVFAEPRKSSQEMTRGELIGIGVAILSLGLVIGAILIIAAAAMTGWLQG